MPILVSPYDPLRPKMWPELFLREENRIRAALGSRAIRIEHVGSTSVPGLAAKPVIDTLLVVLNSADENAYAPALQSAGYRLTIREPNWNEHRMFNGPETDTNLHVFSLGCPEIDRMVLFRNHLRAHSPDRDLYQRTKLDLAQREWESIQHYADAKTAVVEEILSRARVAS